jgi:septal ring factor EnvC (AmiA/AmiB activator)
MDKESYIAGLAASNAELERQRTKNDQLQDTIRDLQATVRGLTESYRNLEMMAHDLHDSISGSLEDCCGMGKD